MELSAKDNLLAVLNSETNKEKSQLTEELAQANKRIAVLLTELENSKHDHDVEMRSKLRFIDRVEEDVTKYRQENAQIQSKLDSMAIETAELHGAMASLHGEISSLQRELEAATEREHLLTKQKKDVSLLLEAKDNELIKIRNEKNVLDVRATQQEKHLIEMAERFSALQRDSSDKLEHLSRDRQTTVSTIAALEQKLKQQTSTNQELNTILGEMRSQFLIAQNELTTLRERTEADAAHIRELQDNLDLLMSTKENAESVLKANAEEHQAMLVDLTSLRSRNEALQAEQRKQRKRIENLEREKQDLFLELAGRTKDQEGTKKAAQDAGALSEELRVALEAERAAKDRAMEENSTLQLANDNYKQQVRELQEGLHAIERQYKEECRLRDQSAEAMRLQQRDTANRIVEFSQRNAKLSAELQMTVEELNQCKKSRDEQSAALLRCQAERDELFMQHTAASAKVQELEDHLEETVARLQASSSEAEDYKQQVRDAADNRNKELARIKQAMEVELAQQKEKMLSETEGKLSAANASHKQQEQALERALARTREAFQRQVEELQSQRQRELQDARSRTAAVAKAMEAMQVSLREESQKNAALTEEVSVLRELVESGGGEAEQRIQLVERERSKERLRLEGQLQDAREQLKLALEQKHQRDQQIQLVESQLTQERESRFACQQRLRNVEEDAQNSAASLERLTEEVNEMRVASREVERKCNVSLRAKEEEIHRLQKRNELLSEAISKLTQTPLADLADKSHYLDRDLCEDECEKTANANSSNTLDPFFVTSTGVCGDGRNHIKDTDYEYEYQQADDDDMQESPSVFTPPPAAISPPTFGSQGDSRQERQEVRDVPIRARDLQEHSSSKVSPSLPLPLAAEDVDSALNRVQLALEKRKNAQSKVVDNSVARQGRPTDRASETQHLNSVLATYQASVSPSTHTSPSEASPVGNNSTFDSCTEERSGSGAREKENPSFPLRIRGAVQQGRPENSATPDDDISPTSLMTSSSEAFIRGKIVFSEDSGLIAKSKEPRRSQDYDGGSKDKKVGKQEVHKQAKRGTVNNGKGSR